MSVDSVQEEGTRVPQALLPLIPAGATQVNELISVVREDQEWTYFCGVQPVFRHADDDRPSFRMFTAQLCCQGACTQAQIIHTFGVSKMSVLRSAEKYRREGVEGFYRPRRGRGPSVMTAEVSAQAQRLLDLGRSRRDVAEEVGVKYDTLRKAINHGRLREAAPMPRQGVAQKPVTPEPPAKRWESAAPVPANGSSRLSACYPAAPRPSSSPVETFPSAAYSVRCRPWRRMGS